MSLGCLGVWKYLPTKAGTPAYLLGSVDRGDIVAQVAASGTLAALTTVQVGCEVSGSISELYADFNSEVKKGQLLARLDPRLFETQVQQAEAYAHAAEMTLINDKANIAATEANFDKAKVDVLDKRRKLRLQKELFDENLAPRDDFDTAREALDASVAARNALEAQLASAQAALRADVARLKQARASIQTAKINLEHTLIYSPVSGTIISRSVDRGQTVAASMATPTLFTIGEDLTKMQVNTSIYEADVGKIKIGMQAAFTVDAYPGEIWLGRIGQIRLAATTVQNVVTYTAIVTVDNPELKLKPGMTAKVKILVDKASDTLKVPNAALRFRPSVTDSEMEKAAGNPATVAPQGIGGKAGSPTQDPGMGMNKRNLSQAVLWQVAETGPALRPVFVRLGLTDGVSTQLLGGNLKQGDKIVTGTEADLENKSATSTSAPRKGGEGGPPGPPPP
jgi:HlyD family secretion protein